MPRATRYYNVTTVPQPGLNNRTRTVPAGCVVGGSSAVNGMIFDRGSAEDYDAWNLVAGEWQEEYAEEWSWDNLLPYFKKSVTFHPPDERMQEEYGITYDVEAAYGGDTPIHSSYAPFQWPAQSKSCSARQELSQDRVYLHHDKNSCGTPSSRSTASSSRLRARTVMQSASSGSPIPSIPAPEPAAMRAWVTIPTRVAPTSERTSTCCLLTA
ncbi:hypothetical protein VUR80DRAFT_9779 [Thermomyces stellatus]